MHFIRFTIHLVVLVVGLFAWESAASAAQFRTCIKWEVQTDDSGRTVPYGANAGVTEDKYSNADSGIIASALGVRIRVTGSGFDQTFDTEPSTGCVSWNDNDGKSYNVRVYAYQTNNQGTYVRTHTHTTSCDVTPGQTYSALLSGYNPRADDTDRLYVGDYLPFWTGQAMAGFALYRYGNVSNKAIHISRDTASGCADSAHYADSNAHITEGRHCIRLSECGTGTDHEIDRKFVAIHEVGHALAALNYGSWSGSTNGTEVASSQNWPGVPEGPSSCNDPAYSIQSVEYNALAFREGFAHFYAARVFNDSSQSGAFNWKNHSSGAHDLENARFGSDPTSGGELENKCCTSSTCRDGHGIIGDWMRFFWDWHTNVSSTCPSQPTRAEMLSLYARTRLEAGPEKDNYFSQMAAGASQMGQIPACLSGSRLLTYAGWNGIDNE